MGWRMERQFKFDYYYVLCYVMLCYVMWCDVGYS